MTSLVFGAITLIVILMILPLLGFIMKEVFQLASTLFVGALILFAVIASLAFGLWFIDLAIQYGGVDDLIAVLVFAIIFFVLWSIRSALEKRESK